MSREIKSKIEWFLANLDLQLEDVRLEASEVRIQTYFDTADIRDAVLGVRAFYDSRASFDRRMFSDAKTMVRCLATSGAIGKIEMLPSHQAEFLTLMNINFGLGEEVDFQKYFRRFIDDVNSLVSEEPETRKTLGNISDEISDPEIVEFVKQIRQEAESAEIYFKALESMGPWQPRLARWLKEETLSLQSERVSLGPVVTTPEFLALQNAFDERRPGYNRMNNFADAVAVAMLIDQVRTFRDKKQRIPRFFIPSKLFLEVVHHADIPHLLTTSESTNGGHDEASISNLLVDKNSVLRGHDYFVFRALFRPSVKGKVNPSALNLSDLRALVADILKTQIPLTQETIASIDVEGRPLSEIIDEIQQFSFLKNVWLGFLEVDYVKRVSDLQRQAKDLVKGKEVRKAIEATRAALRESAKEYKIVQTLWRDLGAATASLQTRVQTNPVRPVDIFKDLGLLRFGFPLKTHDSIRAVVEPIFRGGEAEQFGARNAVIAAYYLERAAVGTEQELNRLVQAAAVMWLAKIDDRLVDLLGNLYDERSLPHFSLRVVYAAAIFRLERDSDKGRGVLDALISEYKKTSIHDGQKKTDLAVGIAYLFFHLWWCLGYRPIWFPKVEGKKPRRTSESQLLIKQAVEYANQARLLAGSRFLPKRAYALNQYLYYMVMGGADNMVDEMKKTQSTLVGYKADKALWQYRFDDTMARYFHRLATNTTDEKEWTDLIGAAKRHLEEARRHSHGDEEVEFYGTILDSYSSLGFGAH